MLDAAMAKIRAEGRGVLVYLRGHEGRGLGITHGAVGTDGGNALEASATPDSREYGVGAQILAELGVTEMRLMTNNPARYGGLDGFELAIVERVPLATAEAGS